MPPADPVEQTPREALLALVSGTRDIYVTGTEQGQALDRALRALEVLAEEVCPIEDSKAERALAILRGEDR